MSALFFRTFDKFFQVKICSKKHSKIEVVVFQNRVLPYSKLFLNEWQNLGRILRNCLPLSETPYLTPTYVLRVSQKQISISVAHDLGLR